MTDEVSSMLRRAGLAALALMVVAAVVCAPAVLAGPEVQPQPSPAARDEVQAALSAMRSQSINAGRVKWARVRREAFRRLGGAQTAADADRAIEAALVALGDNHSSIEPAAGVLHPGEVVSFGVTALDPGGTVAAVAPGGPADTAGIRVGDRLLAMDGARPPGRRGLVVFGDPTDAEGRPRSIELTVAPAAPGGGGLRTARVTAGPVLVDQPPQAKVVGGRFGYVSIPTSSDGDPVAFAGDAQRAIRAADGDNVCGWVVDLRANRGGDPFRMLAAVGPLLGEGAVGGYRDRHSRHPLEYRAGDVLMDGGTRLSVLGRPYRLVHPDAPVAVLTSRMTASSAEELVVALSGRPATRRFGEATRGVASLNRGVDLPSGARLWVTTAMAYDRHGHEWTGPIPPDQATATDWSDPGGDRDPTMVAARAWLDAQPACAAGSISR